MSPYPLPTPLRIGTDLCRITRILDIIISHPCTDCKTRHLRHEELLQRFIKHLLTPREVACFRATVPHHQEETEGQHDPKHERRAVLPVATWLAGRWAAKESVIKAVKPRRLFPRDIEIWRDKHHEHFALIRSFPSSSPTNPPPDVSIVGDTKDASAEAVDTSTTGAGHNNFTTASYSGSKAGVGWLRPENVEFSVDGTAVSGLDALEAADGEKSQLAKVSISHDGQYAFAVAMAVGMPVIVTSSEAGQTSKGDKAMKKQQKHALAAQRKSSATSKVSSHCRNKVDDLLKKPMRPPAHTRSSSHHLLTTVFPNLQDSSRLTGNPTDTSDDGTKQGSLLKGDLAYRNKDAINDALKSISGDFTEPEAHERTETTHSRASKGRAGQPTNRREQRENSRDMPGKAQHNESRSRSVSRAQGPRRLRSSGEVKLTGKEL